jgi:uncharacterized repeat protein (TIGR03803 family)
MRVKVTTVLTLVLLLAAGAWASTETVLYNFTGGSDGGYPNDLGLLVRDSLGNLYGTTEYGGTCGYGTVFQLSSAGTEKVLYSFCNGADGAYPLAGVTMDPSGKIYGTNEIGGAGSCGIVFELSGSTLTTLHAFTCGSDGGYPYASVIRDKKGDLYGTAQSGGTNGYGVAYEISSGSYSVIYNFCSVSGCTDGKNPTSGLVEDKKGNLYSVTPQGGTSNFGIVFELSKSGSTWAEAVLHNFAGGSSDGAYPYFAGLTLGTQKIGKKKKSVIFGVTQQGGPGSVGTAFELTKSMTAYSLTLLHSFTGSGDGAYPEGTLTYLGNKLFGTTNGGSSSDYGTVFELTRKKKTWTHTVLYTFTGHSDGGYPYSGVVGDSSGNLYGVTQVGGTSGAGVAYKVKP